MPDQARRSGRVSARELTRAVNFGGARSELSVARRAQMRHCQPVKVLGRGVEKRGSKQANKAGKCGQDANEIEMRQNLSRQSYAGLAELRLLYFKMSTPIDVVVVVVVARWSQPQGPIDVCSLPPRLPRRVRSGTSHQRLHSKQD